jgi:DNA-binding MarR family transcriptional regulator
VSGVDTGGPPQPSPATTDLGLVDALAQLSFLVHDALAEIAGDHDLSIVQTRLLGILRDREPTMSDLGRHLGLDKSSTTGLVDRAVRRGLVERVPSTTDGRSIHVAITPAGGAVVDQVTARFHDHIQRLVAGLPGRRRELLAQLATRIVSDEAERRGNGS